MFLCAIYRRIVILVVSILSVSTIVRAQEKNETLAEQKKLEQKILASKSVAEKIENASRLAAFYNTFKNKPAIDSIIQLIFEWARASGKKQDMFAAYRWVALPYSQTDFEKWNSYIQQGLDFAIKERLPNEEVLMLSFLGRKYATLRDFNKANEYYSRVDLNKDGIEDTTRYHYFYRKSDMYLVQNKIVEGIKNLFSAKKYAEKSKVTKYIADVNAALGQNFIKIKEYEKAIEYFQRAKKEFEKIADINNLLLQDLFIAEAYRGLKNYPVAEWLYEALIKKSDSVHFFVSKYNAVVGLWGVYYEQNEAEKGAATGKKYKLAEYFGDTGDSLRLYNLKAVYAEIESHHDTADFFYRKSIEYSNKSSAKLATATYIYFYADYLKRNKRYTEALQQMKLSLNMYDSAHEIPALPLVYQNLDSIYTSLGDYKNAWQARGNYYMYRDSLDNQSKKEDILKEEIAAEEESIKKAEEAELKATERKHDIQYRIIILGGILLLIGLLAIGFFHPPKWLIRGLAFVSFIFIFEFIILILDSKLHHWFHGAPLPILGVKVLIACLLVPLHHLVEKKVIHFLQSKKLHRLKTVFKDETPKTIQ